MDLFIRLVDNNFDATRPENENKGVIFKRLHLFISVVCLGLSRTLKQLSNTASYKNKRLIKAAVSPLFNVY